MEPSDPNSEIGSLVGLPDYDRSADGKRLIELRDLVALRKIRIEVVLARKYGDRLDPAPKSQSGADSELDGVLVEYRERTGKSETHRTRVRVGRSSEIGGASAERFGAGLKLNVHL
jgi:hypothetical protein